MCNAWWAPFSFRRRCSSARSKHISSLPIRNASFRFFLLIFNDGQKVRVQARMIFKTTCAITSMKMAEHSFTCNQFIIQTKKYTHSESLMGMRLLCGTGNNIEKCGLQRACLFIVSNALEWDMVWNGMEWNEMYAVAFARLMALRFGSSAFHHKLCQFIGSTFGYLQNVTSDQCPAFRFGMFGNTNRKRNDGWHRRMTSVYGRCIYCW